MRTVPWTRRRISGLISGVAISAAVTGIVAAAALAQGYPVQHVALNDGGVWVTSDQDGLYGRLNRPAGALDAAFYPPGGAQAPGSYQLDVLQDGSAVAAWDQAKGALYPVDVARAVTVADQGANLPGSQQARLSGGTLATLDPGTGALRAIRVDPAVALASVSGLDPATRPLAGVGAESTPGAAALAVSVGGTAYAVSASGRVAILRPADAHGFAAPQSTQLGSTLRAVRATSVGERLIALDPTDGTLAVLGGPVVRLGGAGQSAVLQDPGPDAAAVVVATAHSLLSVDLASGHISTLWTLPSGTSGAPAAPVRLDTCVHGAWAGVTDGYVRACDGQAAVHGGLAAQSALLKPRFRQNRGSIVLNDLTTGAVWDVDAAPREVDDWDAVRPPKAHPASDSSPDTSSAQSARDLPPKANDDTLGARPGRTTVLHVLDNDSDPGGSILSVDSVTEPDVPAARLAIAPDGQSVTVALPAGASGQVHFKYTVDDGKGLTATAAVTVEVRANGTDQAPNPRPGYQAAGWSVVAGGRVTIPVLADWRDGDGDPLALASAQAKAGSALATPDGMLAFTAAMTPGVQVLAYGVSDGIAAPVAGSVTVRVQDPATAKATPATAESDSARGEVGRPIVVRPLDNDLPGSDPAHPDARLMLAGQVASPPGTAVTTDDTAGTVTVTAAKPGSYLLPYTAQFGDAPFAAGTIRVDVAAAPGSPEPPVTMPAVAVLRGRQPVTVDVLAGDHDPSGAVLAVQRATAAPGLQVAVVRGRWLRIDDVSASGGPAAGLVRYTVTDGLTAPVAGEVSVTRLPAPDPDTPSAVDDYASVRAGDTATVAVLDNDVDPGDEPLKLASNVPGAPGPGRLVVRDATGALAAPAGGAAGGAGRAGAAYVSGDSVRYVAPAAVGVPLNVVVEYVAQNTGGGQALGRLHLTVEPAPSALNPDRPPAPPQVTARVVAGDTVTVAIPTSGVDPDGDSVAVTGIGSAASLGRVSAFNAASLTYESFPTSAGTDVFTYQVTDQYGLSATGRLSVAVVPPGTPQPPVATDQTLTAAPGARLSADVVAGAIVSPGDDVTLLPLDRRGARVAAGVTAGGARGPIDVTVPAATGKPLVVVYAVTDGIGDPSTATLTVRSQPGYDIPPVVADAYAAPGAHDATVTVDVLAKCSDPDGPAAGLALGRVFDPAARVVGGRLVLPVSARPRTFAVEVRDAGGATAVGLVHVAAPGAGAPYAIAGKTIAVPKDGGVTVNVADYVADPAGKPLRTTLTDELWAAPSSGLRVSSVDDTHLRLTGSAGYTGPGALTFQVTDGASVADRTAATAIVTVPVQVGPQTPVLRCPADPIGLVEGGDSVSVDVTSVCHVWVADPASAAGLRYTARWRSQPPGVALAGGGTHTLAVTAGAGAVPGAGGSLMVGVVGGAAAESPLAVQVNAAAPPTLGQILVQGVKAGQSATVDVSQYVTSQLRDPVLGLVEIRQATGMPASAGANGTGAVISPAAASHGTMTFAVTVTDVADRTRQDRWAHGLITLQVLGVPDAPGTPAIGRTVLSRAVDLSWNAPAGNGAPIDSYQVSYGGGKRICPASPCTISGLTNGTAYTFTVEAHNLVGWGPASPASAPALPNTIPDAVTALAVSDPRDGTVKLAWNAPNDAGTPVLRYDVSWSGGGQASASGTGLTATGLVNDTVYTFTVIAVNAQGPGPSASAQGESAGAPAAPAAPTFTAANSTNASSRAVQVSWNAVDPNGPGPTTYTLRRSSGGGAKTVCAAVTATTCPDDGLANDGTVYTYSVTAANADVSLDPAAHTSAPSPGTSMEATATPDPISGLSASPTGADGQAAVSFNAPASHGASSTVTCTWSGGSCGTWTFATSGQSGVTETVNGLPNGQATSLTLQDCNGSTGGTAAGNPCDSPASTSVTTYGPLKNLSIQTSASGPVVSFTVSVDPNGKPATVTVQTSRQNQTFTTGVGAWSWSGSDNVGYSSSDTINVTVSDPGRASLSQSATQGTAAAPPPPPSVTVSQGAGCGSACSAYCTNSSCAYIHVTTADFSGSVTCSFNSQDGSGGFVNETYGANQSKDSWNYFGFPGHWVSVTCGGVTGTYTWP